VVPTIDIGLSILLSVWCLLKLCLILYVMVSAVTF